MKSTQKAAGQIRIIGGEHCVCRTCRGPNRGRVAKASGVNRVNAARIGGRKKPGLVKALGALATAPRPDRADLL